MSDEDIVEITSVLHRAWVVTHVALDEVKAERDDGSSDWAAFHGERLRSATEAELRTRGLRDRYVAENRAVITKAFGL